MKRCLVLANLMGESPFLPERVRRLVADDPETEFVVLVSACSVPPLLLLLGGTDYRPLTLARRRAARARRRLEAVGARVVSVRLCPNREPLAAVEDALRGQPFDEVIVAGPARPISRRLRRDVAGRLARSHPELLVTHVVAPALLHEDEVVAGSLAV
jgi:hypothetical protein